MRNYLKINFFAAVLTGTFLGTSAGAESVSASENPADHILVVDNGEQEKAFDLAALDALPQQQFSTSTIWTEGVITFSGPSLRSVLDAAGVESAASIEASALNEYAVAFDVEELEQDVPIIATRMDGKTFGPRQLGPLWIVYPFDRNIAYRSDLVYARSLWQLTRIAVDDVSQ